MPAYRLDLRGGRARFWGDDSLEPAIIITSPDGGSQGSIRVSNGGNLILANDTPGNVYLRPVGQGSATGEFYITPDGRMRANYDGAADTPTYGWSGDPDTGIYRVGINALGVTTGGVPTLVLSPEAVAAYARLQLQGSLGSPVLSNANPQIYRTTNDGSTGYPFNQFGNLVIQSRSNAQNHIVFLTGTSPAPRLGILADGTVRVEAGAKLEVVDTLIIPVK